MHNFFPQMAHFQIVFAPHTSHLDACCASQHCKNEYSTVLISHRSEAILLPSWRLLKSSHHWTILHPLVYLRYLLIQMSGEVCVAEWSIKIYHLQHSNCLKDHISTFVPDSELRESHPLLFWNCPQCIKKTITALIVHVICCNDSHWFCIKIWCMPIFPHNIPDACIFYHVIQVFNAIIIAEVRLLRFVLFNPPNTFCLSLAPNFLRNIICHQWKIVHPTNICCTHWLKWNQSHFV